MGEKKNSRKTLFISLLVSNNARKCLVYGVLYKGRVNESVIKPYIFLLLNNLLPMIALCFLIRITRRNDISLHFPTSKSHRAVMKGRKYVIRHN